jgi:hypothetical protein
MKVIAKFNNFEALGNYYTLQSAVERGGFHAQECAITDVDDRHTESATFIKSSNGSMEASGQGEPYQKENGTGDFGN